MPIPAYRAKQSTDTAGTGTMVLNAAATNARSFAAAYGASARRVMYCISWATGFEIGLGDFDGGTPGSLTRATVLASSNAGALVALPAGTKDVFAVFDPAAREVISISGTSTMALADLGNAVVFTGSSAATLNLPAIATVPSGAGWMIRNAGTAALTIDPSGAETINGAATLVLQAGQSAFVFDGGAAWEGIIAGATTIGAALLAALNSATVADLASGAPVDIASAATTDIGAATSPNVRVTGTTAITSLGTAPAGVRRFVSFAAALTLTHNATSLILPGAANITTAAGDTAVARSLGSGNWVIESYARASGAALSGVLPGLITGSGLTIETASLLGRYDAGTGAIQRIPLSNTAAAISLGINRGTEQATTSGVQIDFTSIPAGVRRITLNLNAVSTNGSGRLLLQIGAGSVDTSGYSSNAGSIGTGGGSTASSGAITSGFVLQGYTNNPTQNAIGSITLTNISGNTWICSGILADGIALISVSVFGGVKSLSGVLDRVRLTNVGGTDAFDAGSINIMWEF